MQVLLVGARTRKVYVGINLEFIQEFLKFVNGSNEKLKFENALYSCYITCYVFSKAESVLTKIKKRNRLGPLTANMIITLNSNIDLF